MHDVHRAPQQAADAPVVPQNVPAGGAAAPGRREPAAEAVHRHVLQLRHARAKRWGVERAAGEVAQPRFEQVVGYLERNKPLPLDQPDRKATSFITSHLVLRPALNVAQSQPFRGQSRRGSAPPAW